QVLVDDCHRQRPVGRPRCCEGVYLIRVADAGADAGVAEAVVAAVVVAPEFHRQVGGGAGRGGAPPFAEVEALRAEDAPDVGLCGRAIHVAVRAPVVLGDANLGAGVISVDPLLHLRDQVDLRVDPAGVGVVGVPEVTGGRVPQQLRV